MYADCLDDEFYKKRRKRDLQATINKVFVNRIPSTHTYTSQKLSSHSLVKTFQFLNESTHKMRM